MNKKFTLGRSIAQIVPFYRQRQEEERQRKEIITNKLVIVMAIVTIVKVAILVLWPI